MLESKWSVESPLNYFNGKLNPSNDVKLSTIISHPFFSWRIGTGSTKTPNNLICLDDITFSKKEVFEKMCKIKSGSYSIDEMSPGFLKTAATFLINHSLFIFSCSINKSQFPDIWKNVQLKPHFKSGRKFDINNYKTIAMPTSLSLVFERLVYKPFKQLIQKQLCNKTAWFSHWSINHNSTPYLLRHTVLWARGQKETNSCFSWYS